MTSIIEIIQLATVGQSRRPHAPVGLRRVACSLSGRVGAAVGARRARSDCPPLPVELAGGLLPARRVGEGRGIMYAERTDGTSQGGWPMQLASGCGAGQVAC